MKCRKMVFFTHILWIVQWGPSQLYLFKITIIVKGNFIVVTKLAILLNISLRQGFEPASIDYLIIKITQALSEKKVTGGV